MLIHPVAALQQHGAEAVACNALHALMALEASPIHAGGFRYVHRDTGLIFEIAPASPDSAGIVTLPLLVLACLQRLLLHNSSMLSSCMLHDLPYSSWTTQSDQFFI